MIRVTPLVLSSLLLGGCGGCATEPAANDAGASPAGTSGTGAGGDAGSGGSPTAGHAGGGAGGIAAAGSGGSAASAGSAGASGNGCAPPKPDNVPDGWVPNTELSCKYPIYVAPTPELMPDPISWETCIDTVPDSLACRQIAISWPHKYGIGLSEMWVPPAGGGAPLLLIAKFVEEPYGRYIVLSEVDGEAPLFAAMSPEPSDTGFSLWSASGARGSTFGIRARAGDGAPKPKLQGVFVGKVGQRTLSLAMSEEQVWGVGYDVNDEYVVRTFGDTITLHPHGTNDALDFYSHSTDPDGLQASTPVLNGQDVFVTAGDLHMAGIMAYDPAHGTRPLVRWYGDREQGAYAFGTDGIDMAWTHGTEHPPGEGVYPVKSIMTATYTTDPDQLQPRRLRSDPTYGMVDNFTVGCGHAANSSAKFELHVVRLSDGHAWKITGSDDWRVVKPIGITCDEVFLLATYMETGRTSLTNRIFRIRIDSLGPGELPD